MADTLNHCALYVRAVNRVARRATILAALITLAAATSADAAPAKGGKAKLVLTRVSSVLYFGAPATVTVNGTKVASVSAGSTETVEIAPGKSAVAVGAWSYPGTWTVNINAQPGRSYALEISPRSASYGPSLLGTIGAAMESDGGKVKNAGAFEIKLTR